MSIKPKDDSTGECLEVLCKKKQQKLRFCQEHYNQAKFGLICLDGTRPTDYERKEQQYKKHKEYYEK